MRQHQGPARRALVLVGALSMLVAATSTAVAQADPSTSEQPVAGAGETGSIDPLTRPRRLQRTSHPDGTIGHEVRAIIEGGPGYIAVGGGTSTGLDHEPLVWLSDDGLSWHAQPLFGDARVASMAGVAPLPGGGYVAAGYDFAPEDVREDMVHVHVWHSDDGYRWVKVPADPTFPGSMVWDVTATPSGVALAGCVAGFHCDIGRVWTSSDGFDWQLQDDIAMAPYDIAADVDGNIVVGGENNAYDLVNAQGTVAASASDWTTYLMATPESQISMVAPYGDGFVIAGALNDSGTRQLLGSAVQVSADGVDWELHEPERLRTVAVYDGTAAGDLIILTGMEQRKKNAWKPVVLWGRDPETFTALKLPKRAKVDEVEFAGATVVDDGSRLLVYGRERGQPAIWATTIE